MESKKEEKEPPHSGNTRETNPRGKNEPIQKSPPQRDDFPQSDKGEIEPSLLVKAGDCSIAENVEGQ